MGGVRGRGGAVAGGGADGVDGAVSERVGAWGVGDAAVGEFGGDAEGGVGAGGGGGVITLPRVSSSRCLRYAVPTG